MLWRVVAARERRLQKLRVADQPCRKCCTRRPYVSDRGKANRLPEDAMEWSFNEYVHRGVSHYIIIAVCTSVHASTIPSVLSYGPMSSLSPILQLTVTCSCKALYFHQPPPEAEEKPSMMLVILNRCRLSRDSPFCFNLPRRVLQSSKQGDVLGAFVPLHFFALFSLGAHDTNALILLLTVIRHPLEQRMRF